MQKSKFAAIIVILSLTACSIMSPSVSYEQKLQPWIGKSAEQLYDTWGTPAQTTPIDNNTIMVTYNQITNSPIDGDFEPYADELNYEAMAVPSFGIIASSPLYYCSTSFVLKNDVVTSYNFSGDDCL